MQIMKKALLTLSLLTTLTACQLVSPIFVEYNGVRMDVAQWINQQTLMTMQQKRTLAQLSITQQKLVKIDQIKEHEKVAISTQNAIALYCANQHLSPKKIGQLQDQIFNAADKKRILEKFDQEFPKVKLDTSKIECDLRRDTP